MAHEGAILNTDKEIWRRKEGDYYSDSIFITEKGTIGFQSGGFCVVRPFEEWFGAVRNENKRIAELEDRVTKIEMNNVARQNQ